MDHNWTGGPASSCKRCGFFETADNHRADCMGQREDLEYQPLQGWSLQKKNAHNAAIARCAGLRTGPYGTAVCART